MPFLVLELDDPDGVDVIVRPGGEEPRELYRGDSPERAADALLRKCPAGWLARLKTDGLRRVQGAAAGAASPPGPAGPVGSNVVAKA